MRRTRALLGVLVLACFALVPVALAEEVVETYDDGTPRRRYHVDGEGRRHGAYVEFHPHGMVAVRARYREGVLNGVRAEFHPNGRKSTRAVYRTGRLTGAYEEWTEDGRPTYKSRFKDGVRHGKTRAWRDGVDLATQVWSDGVLVVQNGVRVFPKTQESIETSLDEILRPQQEATGAVEAWSAAVALARLKAYRYVCGVPWEDVVLDDACTRYAQAASRICAALGHVTHEPPNPGWPAGEYATAAHGAINCNLHGSSRSHTSVDSYMDDSDPSNIEKLGHRCWSLNPAMRKTGFGETPGKAGGWVTAMWATDDSRGKVPRLDALCYPARGWMPRALFGSRHAWSVQLDPRDYPRVDKTKIKVSVFRLDERYLPEASPLEFDHLGVNQEARGVRTCIAFRPASLDLKSDTAYWVRLSGLDAKAKPRQDVSLQFLVRFFGPEHLPAKASSAK